MDRHYSQKIGDERLTEVSGDENAYFSYVVAIYQILCLLLDT